MTASLQQFLQKLETDVSLRVQVASCQTNAAVVDLASKNRFQFSVADYEAHLDTSLDLGKLSDGAAILSGPKHCPTGWP
ncbi:Nif11-like leader peptide family natural product precursor [Hyalangium sp.]|uniref:Nif11-like leader peptide family natural product precursor n=1 Tax=Hyalangium sp. TaxID=2028555 RepID=UPI002D4A881D|nr:Nif11-like leader peptide family natural product precursor [Hyalangium sp.]HYH99592.1 Nif11-like leader peptide family natural product precursor [Hyalangium sp.]